MREATSGRGRRGESRCRHVRCDGTEHRGNNIDPSIREIDVGVREKVRQGQIRAENEVTGDKDKAVEQVVRALHAHDLKADELRVPCRLVR